jgi:hypothetical protein
MGWRVGLVGSASQAKPSSFGSLGAKTRTWDERKRGGVLSRVSMILGFHSHGTSLHIHGSIPSRNRAALKLLHPRARRHPNCTGLASFTPWILSAALCRARRGGLDPDRITNSWRSSLSWASSAFRSPECRMGLEMSRSSGMRVCTYCTYTNKLLQFRCGRCRTPGDKQQCGWVGRLVGWFFETQKCNIDRRGTGGKGCVRARACVMVTFSICILTARVSETGFETF